MYAQQQTKKKKELRDKIDNKTNEEERIGRNAREKRNRNILWSQETQD